MSKYATKVGLPRSDLRSRISALPVPMMILLLPAPSTHSEDLGDPDEDVDGVGVDGDGVVDGVEDGHAVLVGRRVVLGAVQDLGE